MGVFFAFMAGMTLHVMAQIILLSFLAPGPNIVLVSSIVGGGIGGSVAGFFAWYSPEAERKENLQVLGLALTGGIAGALLGLLRGVHTERSPLALVGIPELASLIYGTVIGVNLVPLCYFIFRRLRGERFKM